MRNLLIVFIIALALGGAGGWFGHQQYGTRFGSTEAVVVSKRLEEERLVLVLEADEHAMLATFRNRASDVDELVAIGDTLRIAGTGGVFTDDPQILEVRRGAHGGGAEGHEGDHGGGDGGVEEGGPNDGGVGDGSIDDAGPIDGAVDGAVEVADGGDAGATDAGTTEAPAEPARRAATP